MFLVLAILTLGVFFVRPAQAWGYDRDNIDGPVVGISVGNTVSCISHIDSRFREHNNLTASTWVSCVENKDIIPKEEFKPVWPSRLQFQIQFNGYAGKTREPSGTEASKPNSTILDTKVATSIIKHLTKVAEEKIGMKVSHGVLTVPVWFNDAQRVKSKEAGTDAGLAILRVINAPTAASLAYGLDRVDERDERYVLVVDMGGTTLDVSALVIEEGVFEILEVSGDRGLGGNTINKKWLEYVLAKSEAPGGIDLRKDQNAIDVLNDAIEVAKVKLSSEEYVTLPFPAFYQGGIFYDSLSRTEFDSIMREELREISESLDHAIRIANVSKSQFTEVVLSGGSTNIPLVRNMINEYFHKDNVPIRMMSHLNATEVVAIGAAIQGSVFSMESTSGCMLGFEVNTLSWGVESAGGLMHHLLRRGSGLPRRRSQYFTTVGDGQDMATIKVFRGERPLVSDNVFMGSLPPLPIKSGKARDAVIEVTLEVDHIEEIVVVSARDIKEKKTVSYTMNMTQRAPLSEHDFERIILEAEGNSTQDGISLNRVQSEVDESVVKAGGREKADDGWEIVPLDIDMHEYNF